MTNLPADVIIGGPEDLPKLGAYLRQRRYESGLGLANEAAPYLGVGVRLLTQLESGTRGKRGVTLSKLLEVLRGLGLELVVRPRAITGHAVSSLVATTRANGVTKKPAPTPKRRKPRSR